MFLARGIHALACLLFVEFVHPSSFDTSLCIIQLKFLSCNSLSSLHHPTSYQRLIITYVPVELVSLSWTSSITLFQPRGTEVHLRLNLRVNLATAPHFSSPLASCIALHSESQICTLVESSRLSCALFLTRLCALSGGFCLSLPSDNFMFCGEISGLESRFGS